MRILQVSPSDAGGGAHRVACDLMRGFRDAGHTSWLAVARPVTGDPGVLPIQIGRPRPPWARAMGRFEERLRSVEKRVRGLWRVRHLVTALSEGRPGIDRLLGHEDFHFPGSRRLLDLPPQRPEIVHLHNLHGRYFDLEFLPELSRRALVCLTLHDTWMLTGHCAYTLGCERWRTGCGRCPDLTIYPSLERDGTAFNWRRKRRIYARSRLHVLTPSGWLMNKVAASMLAPGTIARRVIPNGVDLGVFRPAPKAEARRDLGIEEDVAVVLTVANGGRRNRFKDVPGLEQAMGIASQRLAGKKLMLFVLGERADPEEHGSLAVRFAGFEHDQARVARHYQAADVYAHAARPEAENFPTTILEAFACGAPVVATEVGGIPEQVREGVTGHLVPSGDPEALARRLVELLSSEERRQRMSAECAAIARREYDVELQVKRYLSWYEEIISSTA